MHEKKIAIVGLGFVGSAVAYGFHHPHIIQQHIDPKLGNEIMDIDVGTDFVFVCVPTPMDDFSIVREVMEEILSNDIGGTIILKSTVPPNILEEMTHPDVVYNPEFLTEKSAQEQFIDPPFHILGGADMATEDVQLLYEHYSLCNPAPFLHMTMEEASLVKYTINSFLATKVTFFNQMFDLCSQFDANPSVVFNAVGMDDRIGFGHTKVPGFDSKRGFGGACFPKDTKAIIDVAGEGVLSIIEEVIKTNNNYRSRYELDDREKEQNIVYFPTEM